MKIAMIGQSGVGKTTFLSALYETLRVGNSSSGFYITPTANSFDESLFLSGKLDAISFTSDRFYFPPGTSRTTLWSFDLRYQGQFVCNFEIMEYRGGILNQILEDTSDEHLKNEVYTLSAHIALSDSVILFADSIELTFFENIREARRRSGVSTINQLFQSYDSFFPNRNLNFLIALTKADAVDIKWKSNNYQPLIERGIDAFKPIIEFSQQNLSWKGGIVPVSSIGEGNVETTLTPPSRLDEPLIVSSKLINYPQPMNVEHALFYSIGMTLQKMRERIYGNVENNEQEIRRALSQANVANSIWSLLTNKTSATQIVQTLLEQQAKDQLSLRQFNSFTEPLFTTALQKVQRVG
jgi:hypothetical protein